LVETNTNLIGPTTGGKDGLKLVFLIINARVFDSSESLSLEPTQV